MSSCIPTKRAAIEGRGKPRKLTTCRKIHDSAVVLLFSIQAKVERHVYIYHMVDNVYSKINRVKPKALPSMTSSHSLTFCQLVARTNITLTDVYPPSSIRVWMLLYHPRPTLPTNIALGKLCERLPSHRSDHAFPSLITSPKVLLKITSAGAMDVAIACEC